MILKDGKILLQERKNAHGAGEYAFPGGHLENGESFTECAIRETREEAGIEISNIQFQMVANVLEYMPKHYVHIQIGADWKSGEPQILEPEKTESWGWYDLNNLPQPLFKTIPRTLEAYKTGQYYFDSK